MASTDTINEMTLFFTTFLNFDVVVPRQSCRMFSTSLKERLATVATKETNADLRFPMEMLIIVSSVKMSDAFLTKAATNLLKVPRIMSEILLIERGLPSANSRIVNRRYLLIRHQTVAVDNYGQYLK